MLLPLGDDPNPPGRPVVNYALIAINIAVYLFIALPLSGTPADPSNPLLQAYADLIVERLDGSILARDIAATLSAYDLVVFEYGFRPAEPSVTGLFTSMFLHGGFMHLAGNMLFLWIYGDNVEHRLGRVGYLAAYLGTGLAATLAHAALNSSSEMPTVGASGAISGALGFYFLFFPRNRVRLLVAFFPFLVDVIIVPARWVLGMYLVLDNLLPFLFTRGAATGVAYGAHIGGFVAGLGAAWVIDRRERTGRPREYRQPSPASGEGEAEIIASLVERRRFDDAARLLFGGDEKLEQQVPSHALVGLARGLTQGGHPTAALSLFRRVLARRPGRALEAEAHAGAGVVQLHHLDRPTAAWQHFLDAIDLDPTSVAADEARRGLEVIERQQTHRLQPKKPREPRGY